MNKPQKNSYICDHLSYTRKFILGNVQNRNNPNVHHQGNGEINCGRHTVHPHTATKMKTLTYMQQHECISQIFSNRKITKKLYKSIYTKLKINKSKFRVASIGGNTFFFKQQRIAVTPRMEARRCNMGGAQGIGDKCSISYPGW